MKPSWDDAPEWARFFCSDIYGSFYSEIRPNLVDGMWVVPDEGGFKVVESIACVDREIVLERRP